jgi:transposase
VLNQNTGGYMQNRNKKFIVNLTENEKHQLLTLTKKGNLPARKMLHTQILLMADSSDQGNNWCDEEIANALEISTKTIYRVRQSFVENGLDAALNRKEHKNFRPRKLGGNEEAHLVALCCSKAPEGACRWTLRMLADKLVELEIVEGISHETVRKTLKKTNLSLG